MGSGYAVLIRFFFPVQVIRCSGLLGTSCAGIRRVKHTVCCCSLVEQHATTWCETLAWQLGVCLRHQGEEQLLFALLVATWDLHRPLCTLSSQRQPALWHSLSVPEGLGLSSGLQQEEPEVGLYCVSCPQPPQGHLHTWSR